MNRRSVPPPSGRKRALVAGMATAGSLGGSLSCETADADPQVMEVQSPAGLNLDEAGAKVDAGASSRVVDAGLPMARFSIPTEGLGEVQVFALGRYDRPLCESDALRLCEVGEKTELCCKVEPGQVVLDLNEGKTYYLVLSSANRRDSCFLEVSIKGNDNVVCPPNLLSFDGNLRVLQGY